MKLSPQLSVGERFIALIVLDKLACKLTIIKELSLKLSTFKIILTHKNNICQNCME